MRGSGQSIRGGKKESSNMSTEYQDNRQVMRGLADTVKEVIWAFGWDGIPPFVCHEDTPWRKQFVSDKDAVEVYGNETCDGRAIHASWRLQMVPQDYKDFEDNCPHRKAHYNLLRDIAPTVFALKHDNSLALRKYVCIRHLLWRYVESCNMTADERYELLTKLKEKDGYK
jgi:hypothetical protein